MNEKPDEKSESLKKDDTRVPPVQDFLSKPDLTACKVIQKKKKIPKLPSTVCFS
jgi:hypothetical protein